MIALASAVPFEMDRLRSALHAPCSAPLGPYTLHSGQLAGREVALLVTGIGKANAAAALSLLCALRRPQALLLVGCGGAFPHSGLQVGDLALAVDELFGDEGVQTPDGFVDLADLGFPLLETPAGLFYNRLPLDAALCDAARPRLAALAERRGLRCGVGSFVTVSRCSGTDAQSRELAGRSGAVCENMEGAAAALVCTRFGVPLLELRGISNLTGDRDRAAWDLRGAAAIAQDALLDLLPEL